MQVVSLAVCVANDSTHRAHSGQDGQAELAAESGITEIQPKTPEMLYLCQTEKG